MLRLRLLGGLTVEIDGQAASAPGGRCGSLLAWLALHGGMQPRARVAARLWPDVLDESARRSLRTALLDLRRDLGPAGERYLVATRDEVGLGPAGEIWVDARAFSDAVEEGRLADALKLGEGELLPEFEHEWVYAARDEHRHAYEQLVERLATEAEAAGDLTGSIEHTRRMVAMDPLAEAPARELIRRLAAADDRAAALAAYDRHRERLRTDLGMVPSAATRAMVDEIRAGAPSAQEASDRRRADLPAPLERLAARPLFGRTTELGVLRDRWRSVIAERSLSCVVIGGEPGIGKTRLLADLCALAHGDGATVVYGRCHEDAPFPYAPLAEALRRYSDAVGPSVVAADAGPGATQLARLVPQIATALDDETTSSPGADADGEALLLLDAIASVVTGAARSCAAVLALEDLHWADRPTLRVLAHLARTAVESPVLVVASYRDTETGDDDPLAATLARLRHDRLVETLRVGALETPALVELARACRPSAPEVLLDAVIARTGGNPYFVEEFLRDVAATGAERLEDVGVPETVEDLIVRRLGRLSGEARTVLGAAAVIGAEFDIEVLAQATETAREALLDALDDALTSGLISELPPTGRFSFAHALVRETLYRRLSGTRRAHLHGRVGHAIEQLHGDSADHLPALARHHELAGDRAGALRYHLLAGDAAARIHGADDALHHYSCAIEAATALGLRSDDARLYGAYHRRALLRQRAGDVAGAVDDAEAALTGARAAGDSAAELEALNRRAFMRRFQRVEDSVAGHEEALIAAQDSGDVRAQAATLARLAITQSSLLRFDEAMRLAEQAREVAERAGDDEALALALDALKLAALQLGDLELLDEATSRLLELRDRAGPEWSFHWVEDWALLERAFIDIATANWEAALAGVAAALDANRRLHDRFAEPMFLDAFTWIHRSRGDHEAAVAQGTEAVALARQLAGPEWVASTGASLGWALLEAGSPADAAAQLEPAVAAAERVGARAQLLRCTALLSWAASDLGDRERAITLADEAQELLATATAPPGRMFLLGAHSPLAVARVRLACGEGAAAIALVEPVLEAATAAGWRETIAYATLLAGTARGDRATIEQALALAERDGLGWVARQSEAKIRELSAARR